MVEVRTSQRGQIRRWGMVVALAFLLTACSTPAPIVTPEPTPTPAASATPEPNGPTTTIGSNDPTKPGGANAGTWESSVSKSEPTKTPTPTATPEPSGPPPSDPPPVVTVPATFNLAGSAPAGSGCSVTQAFEAQGKPGNTEGLPDGWWVVMLASRAPEDNDPKKWETFGFLVDLVCAYAPDHPAQAKAAGGAAAEAELAAGRPFFSNNNGELRWVPMDEKAKFTCVDTTSGCAPGKFKRKWPQYPAGNIPVAQRQWPVVAIRVVGGKITAMQEIAIPNDPAPQATGDTTTTANQGVYQPNANTGALPPGTLGANR